MGKREHFNITEEQIFSYIKGPKVVEYLVIITYMSM